MGDGPVEQLRSDVKALVSKYKLENTLPQTGSGVYPAQSLDSLQDESTERDNERRES